MKRSRERILEEARNYIPHDIERKGLDTSKMIELHDLMQRGVVDIGPFPDHSAPLEDIRYKGPDAEELGAEILARTNGHNGGDMPKLRPDYRLTQ
jgi:hypothetical protein